MRFWPSLYRLALRAYPSAFRLRYTAEMARVFGEGLRDAQTAGSRSTLCYCGNALIDLLASSTRERAAALDPIPTAPTLFAIVAGGFAGYVDFHASEVQATLLVLIATNFVLGCGAPQGAWRHALIIAALLPAVHVTVYALGNTAANHGYPYLSRLMIFGPALVASLVGTYGGVLARYLGGELTGYVSSRGGAGPKTMA
jgi:hypothetical protein